jgi:uncharacterized protein YcnI
MHSMTPLLILKRSALVTAASLGILLVSAAPAWAHVTIDPSSAPKGSDAVLAFTVPNETEDANTTQVLVVFPSDHPIADASVEAVPGWTANVEHARASKPIQTDEGAVNEYVSEITWTGGSIPPGQFQEFKVAVGLPDDASALTFKALQTYSNGTIVRWIETPAPGGEEPEHPAPVLKLTSTSTDSGNAAAAESSNDDDSNALAIIAIGVGGVALIVGVIALLRRPRATVN